MGILPGAASRRQPQPAGDPTYTPLPGVNISGPRHIGPILRRVLHKLLLRRLKIQPSSQFGVKSRGAA
jgi:hypothetical protein